THDVKQHSQCAITTMGLQKEIKTNNGPTYTSNSFQSFLQTWGIAHKTGILHSPTGHSIVERMHQT
ncbi:PO113 protein, partial [Neodrepanis coruscans]|nr:PO113 protein [Neodrepanis coruscans]